MYYLLHRQNVPDKVTTPPDGLSDLMSDICREVLRVHPPAHCLYKFIADYLDALLRVREKTMITQSVIDELILSTHTVCNFLQQSGVCYDKAKKAALVIQKSFHDFLKVHRSNKNEQLQEFKELELVNELITKCNFTEREIQRSSPAIRKAFRQFISDYLNLMKATVYGASAVVPIVQFTFKATVQGNLDILNTSATIIQATFRGYKVRAHLRSLSLEFDMFITKVMKHPYVKKEKIKKCAPFDPLTYECMKDEVLYCKLHKAAEIIQRNFRRFHNKVLYNYAHSRRFLDKAATIIEKTYRGFSARKRYKTEKSFESYKKQYGQPKSECQKDFYNQKATEIQKIFKGYEARKEFKKKKDIQIYGKQYSESIGEDQYKEFNDKATLIQANYRGYITRQHFKHDQRLYQDHTVKKTEENMADFQQQYGEFISEDQRNFYNEEATKIQSNYRGYIARKHFKHDHEMSVHHKANERLHEGTPLRGSDKPEDETPPSKDPEEEEQAVAPQEAPPAEGQIPADKAKAENQEKGSETEGNLLY